MAMEIYPGITVDPEVRFGKPCLVGTRLDVATILGALAAGESFDAVIGDYRITRKQILDALGYAAHVASHLPPAVQKAS
jgi:uncharacterized protein (DUF433 family)